MQTRRERFADGGEDAGGRRARQERGKQNVGGGWGAKVVDGGGRSLAVSSSLL